ncbi:hypothetical protein EEL31_08865 [Brevibacillus laterosporus]|uniref:Uncharacterized protein n=1 Tax=Brevibacillus laterosporus TaxID=1465 RepID=A0A518VCE3_BRELA|nr:hypothetical protein EEL30_21700 [Brevibacillus laterosporus]TPG68619.1 hypothetical protein EEL31_08865 [Brevibacillus laterosporus]
MVLVVDIVLKDGTTIKECSIYNEGVIGEMSIQNVEKLISKFQVQSWENERKVIPFQTRMMKGYIPVPNVESYMIRTVD